MVLIDVDVKSGIEYHRFLSALAKGIIYEQFFFLLW